MTFSKKIDEVISIGITRFIVINLVKSYIPVSF